MHAYIRLNKSTYLLHPAEVYVLRNERQPSNSFVRVVRLQFSAAGRRGGGGEQEQRSLRDTSGGVRSLRRPLGRGNVGSLVCPCTRSTVVDPHPNTHSHMYVCTLSNIRVIATPDTHIHPCVTYLYSVYIHIHVNICTCAYRERSRMFISRLLSIFTVLTKHRIVDIKHTQHLSNTKTSILW